MYSVIYVKDKAPMYNTIVYLPERRKAWRYQSGNQRTD